MSERWYICSVCVCRLLIKSCERDIAASGIRFLNESLEPVLLIDSEGVNMKIMNFYSTAR